LKPEDGLLEEEVAKEAGPRAGSLASTHLSSGKGHEAGAGGETRGGARGELRGERAEIPDPRAGPGGKLDTNRLVSILMRVREDTGDKRSRDDPVGTPGEGDPGSGLTADRLGKQIIPVSHSLVRKSALTPEETQESKAGNGGTSASLVLRVEGTQASDDPIGTRREPVSIGLVSVRECVREESRETAAKSDGAERSATFVSQAEFPEKLAAKQPSTPSDSVVIKCIGVHESTSNMDGGDPRAAEMQIVARDSKPEERDGDASAPPEVESPSPEGTEKVPTPPPDWDPDKRRIDEISVSLPTSPDGPADKARSKFAEYGPSTDATFASRDWIGCMYQWEASALYHRPLYFEEVNAERYGYSICPVLQPAVSGAQFFTTVPILPYKMSVQRPRECVYVLGHYRPGSVVPYQFQRLPVDAKAGVVEAGVITGLIFAIP
jgi:hypothetical protein